MLAGETICGLLVTSIAQVLLMTYHSEGQVIRELLIPEAHEIGRVVAVIVADQDLRDPLPKVTGNAVQDLRERAGSIVGDNDNANPKLGLRTTPCVTHRRNGM